MNISKGYVMNRMNLDEVCTWLTIKGYKFLAEYFEDKFTDHTWTKDGMLRTDVIKEIFETAFASVDGRCMMWRHLQCDVATIMNIVPYGEAHVD